MKRVIYGKSKSQTAVKPFNVIVWDLGNKCIRLYEKKTSKKPMSWSGMDYYKVSFIKTIDEFLEFAIILGSVCNLAVVDETADAESVLPAFMFC